MLDVGTRYTMEFTDMYRREDKEDMQKKEEER